MHMRAACYLCGVVYLSLCFAVCSASAQERVPVHPVDGEFIDGWLIKSSCKSYTIHDGLAYDWVQAIHHGPDGTLWFGTARGSPAMMGRLSSTLLQKMDWQMTTSGRSMANPIA